MKSISAIRCVTFDLTGTVYRFSRSIGETYSEAALSLGFLKYSQNPDLMNRCFKEAFRQTLQSNPCYSGSAINSEREWWSLVVRRCIHNFDHKCNFLLPSILSSKSVFDRYFQAVYQAYGREDSFQIYEDAEETLQILRQRGYILGVATNSPHRTVDCTLPLLRLDKYFDFALSCMDAGAMKPHSNLFQLALNNANDINCQRKEVNQGMLDSHLTYWPSCSAYPQTTNIEPSQILHIGDEFIADYEGAKSAGFQALLIDRSNNSTNKNLYEIYSLRELLDILPDRIS